MKSKLLIGTFAALLTAAVGCDHNRGSSAQTTPSGSAGYTAQAQQPLPPEYQTDPNLTRQSAGGAVGDGSLSDPNAPGNQRPMGGTDVGNGVDTSGSNGQRNSSDMVPPPDNGTPTAQGPSSVPDTGTGAGTNTGTGTPTSPGTPGTGTNPGTPIVPPTGSGPGTGTGTGTQPGTGPGTGAPTGGAGAGAG